MSRRERRARRLRRRLASIEITRKLIMLELAWLGEQS